MPKLRLVLALLLCSQVLLVAGDRKKSIEFRRLVSDVVEIKHGEAFQKDVKPQFASIELFLMDSSVQRRIAKLPFQEKRVFTLHCIIFGNIFDGGPMGLLAESLGRDCALVGAWLVAIPSDLLEQEWQLSQERIRQVHYVGECFQKRK